MNRYGKGVLFTLSMALVAHLWASDSAPARADTIPGFSPDASEEQLKTELLEQACEATGYPAGPVDLGAAGPHGPAVQDDAAAVGAVYSGDQIEERRFPRATGTHQRNELLDGQRASLRE